MVTDISLGVTDEEITVSPPDTTDAFTAEILEGTATYGSLHVLPMLTIAGDVNSAIEEPAAGQDSTQSFFPCETSFGSRYGSGLRKEDNSRFVIGNPLDMETKLCLDLEYW